MQVKFVADDDEVVRCRTEGDIKQNAFKPNKEPLAEMFGKEMYAPRCC